MPNKKINQLDVRVAVATDLMLVGDPATGTAYKSTLDTLPLVPYSGATGAVNLGAYDLTVNGLTIGKGLAGLSNNTALGHQSLFHATTGNNNTGVGYQSLHNITTGQYNTALGQSSMFTATSAAQNVAIGLNALLYTTSGSSNVVMGVDGLQHNTTGASNVALGYNAGSHITGGSTPNTTASNSVFIGRDTKALADGQSNQIVIGYNAVGNGSDTATIGNSSITANYFSGSIILNKSQNNPTATNITNDTSGTNSRAGVSFLSNTASGQFSLQKYSTLHTTYKINAASDAILYNDTSGDISILNDYASGKIKWAAGGASTAQATLTAAGRLLLGTTTESTYIFDAVGTARISSSITGGSFVKSGGTSAQILVADGSVITAGTNITISGGTISSSGGGGGSMAIGGAITSATAGSVLFAGASGVLQQDNANFFWDDVNNRLGIGTASPGELLEIRANANSGYGFSVINLNAGTSAQAQSYMQSNAGYLFMGKRSSAYTSYKNIVSGASFLYSSASDFALLAENGKMTFCTGTLSAAPTTLTAAGRLLLGTTTESTYLLDVNGTARVSSGAVLHGGSGTYDYGLEVRNNAGTTTIFQVRNDSQVYCNAALNILSSKTLYCVNYGGNGTSPMTFSGGGTQGQIMAFENSGVNHTYTSGSVNIFSVGAPISYRPTSGTGVFNTFAINPTINQTGGASGITRGIYVNPTLTAAADFRAIEVANGITILGASTTAKASLRIPSGTAPTTPNNGDIWFTGTDLKIQVGGVTKTFTLV